MSQLHIFSVVCEASGGSSLCLQKDQKLKKKEGIKLFQAVWRDCIRRRFLFPYLQWAVPLSLLLHVERGISSSHSHTSRGAVGKPRAIAAGEQNCTRAPKLFPSPP